MLALAASSTVVTLINVLATSSPASASDVIKKKLANNSRAIKDLETKRRNLKASIARRQNDLATNPQNLPATAPGDDLNPAISRRGHELLISKDKFALAAVEAQIAQKEGYATKLLIDLGIAEKAEKEAREKLAKEALKKAEKEAAEKAAKEAAEKAAKEALEKAGKEAIEKGAKEGAEKIGKALAKKGAGAVAKKIPIVGIGFFVYDWYSGGLGYAANEAVWPLSEAWRDDGIFSP